MRKTTGVWRCACSVRNERGPALPQMTDLPDSFTCVFVYASEEGGGGRKRRRPPSLLKRLFPTVCPQVLSPLLLLLHLHLFSFSSSTRHWHKASAAPEILHFVRITCLYLGCFLNLHDSQSPLSLVTVLPPPHKHLPDLVLFFLLRFPCLSPLPLAHLNPSPIRRFPSLLPSTPSTSPPPPPSFHLLLLPFPGHRRGASKCTITSRPADAAAVAATSSSPLIPCYLPTQSPRLHPPPPLNTTQINKGHKSGGGRGGMWGVLRTAPAGRPQEVRHLLLSPSQIFFFFLLAPSLPPHRQTHGNSDCFSPFPSLSRILSPAF